MGVGVGDSELTTIKKTCITSLYSVQWNLSKTDTIGTDSSVLNGEVSLISGVVEYTNEAFGTD